MRRLYLLCCLTLAVAGTLSAQQNNFGVKAGMNISNHLKKMSVPGVASFKVNTTTLIGYQVGVFYKTKIGHHLSLVPELNFSVTGSKSVFAMEDRPSFDVKEKLAYLDLPVFLQYNFGPLYIGAGPSVSFLLDSKLKDFDGNDWGGFDYSTVDAGANATAGVKLIKKLDLKLRYYYGLVNIQKDPGYSEVKNRFLNISLLYSLK